MAQYDAVIIGGGISGLMAAIALGRQKRRVALVSKGDPVCRLSTGCIDILRGHGALEARIENLPENHPYHLVGMDGISRAMAFFTSIMQGAGLNYVGDIRENRWILSPAGTIRQTALVPESMVHGNVQETNPLHLITFKGMKDFFPGYVTMRFHNAAVHEFDAEDASTLALATKFNNPVFQEKFVEWVRRRKLPAGKIGIPAVMGTKPGVFLKISQALGRKIFEIPTLPPSVPGLRMFNALKNCLQESGGDMFWGHAVERVKQHSGVIEEITLENPGRAPRIEGKAFILATGSFISAGLYARQDGVIEERVFGLKPFAPEKRDSWFKHNFFETGHEIEKSGIVVNNSFQPEHADFKNLFVCGSILAFSEIMKYGCGHGMAISTGVAAAQKCEEQLG